MKAGRAKRSKRLVIDADVAHAAGDKDAESPVSRSCRSFLENVLDICHRVVMTRTIEDEWNRHKSRFSSKWLISMYARKKVFDVECREDRKLRESAARIATSEDEESEITKDVHLLEAAMATDLTVVSHEVRAPKAFSRLASERKEIQNIVWVNPAKEPEKVISWLQAGAGPEKNRMLGSFASPD